MDLKILSLATDKTTDKLQEFLQTLKADDVSTVKGCVVWAGKSTAATEPWGCSGGLSRQC